MVTCYIFVIYSRRTFIWYPTWYAYIIFLAAILNLRKLLIIRSANSNFRIQRLPKPWNNSLINLLHHLLLTTTILNFYPSLLRQGSWRGAHDRLGVHKVNWTFNSTLCNEGENIASEVRLECIKDSSLQNFYRRSYAQCFSSLLRRKN